MTTELTHDAAETVRYQEQERIDAFLRDTDREWQAQIVLEDAQTELDISLQAFKRALNPPQGCSMESKMSFWRQSAEHGSTALVQMQALILILYQLSHAGCDLTKSAKFTELLEASVAEELGIC